MAKNNDMHEELLKQMDQNSGSTEQSSHKSIEKIFTRDAARVKRMKWIAGCSWLLVLILFIAGGMLSVPMAGRLLTPPTPYQNMIWPKALPVILRGVVTIAAILTGSFFIRSRSLQMRQIQRRLSEIEKLLRKLDRD